MEIIYVIMSHLVRRDLIKDDQMLIVRYVNDMRFKETFDCHYRSTLKISSLMFAYH